ncbi:translation initiation factor IF-2 [Clostridium sp. D2Q-11]|uniref:Translation initiation factor IF-2 n=1 Tax=Anaeromonas frigoriresistens TaxID=2683708 RepID=A0A942UZI9_9FIRM|nr:translation initiation factor IF-2 [Anaeromonas frigoriresistens]MBS4539891.1 translation initiation factor IF-2 [Anaeromonas frigoriresistens]
MTKKRVYELAKELNISSKELINKMNDLDIEVSSHMSTIEDEESKILKELFNNKSDSDIKEELKSKVEEEDKTENSNNTNHTNIEEEKQNIIEIEGNITVKDLAEKLSVNSNELIGKLIGLGIMANLNQELDYETTELIAAEYGYAIEEGKTLEEIQEDELDSEDSPESLILRPPVVTVMGHVDHGKTSLLDSIRESHVTEKEAGGITQHIGASTVKINDNKIVFLDTPGHEAFTSMRARGAQVTDIAILVVAADDGVMPQTIEAINHAKAANVPIIVAINKMDKPEANPDRVKQELTEHGLVPEDWGGETITVPVSAINKEGLDELLEMILLVSEMGELKANPNRKAVGTIIEAELDKGRGPVATVLVQKGTLRVSDSIIAGTASGRVRAMIDSQGKRVKKAGPSTAVEILGLSEVPHAGDKLYAVKDDKKARVIADERKEQIKRDQIKSKQNISLDELFNQIKTGEVKDLNIIIKADVQGSIEAVKDALVKLSNEEVKVNPIHGGVGAITETDIMLATASNAIVIGFNVRPTTSASNLADRESVDVRTYRIIYKAIEDIEAAIKGMLDPEYKEVVQGRAEVRATFKVPNAGTIAGVYMLNGKVTRNSKLRLLRDNVVVHEGEISSLRRFKDDVKEIATGYEGGIGIENYNDLKEGDIIEAYIMEEIER